MLDWFKRLIYGPPPKRIAGPWQVGFSPWAVEKRLELRRDRSYGKVVSTLFFDIEAQQYSGSRIDTFHSNIDEAKRLIDEATRKAGWQLIDEEEDNVRPQ